jgi:hypothetical protein
MDFAPILPRSPLDAHILIETLHVKAGSLAEGHLGIGGSNCVTFFFTVLLHGAHETGFGYGVVGGLESFPNLFAVQVETGIVAARFMTNHVLMR